MKPLPLPLFEMILLSLRSPGAAAQMVVDLKLPRNALWMILGVLTALNTGFFTLSSALFGSPFFELTQMGLIISSLFLSPLFLFVLMFVLMAVYFIVLHRLGQGFKGQGSLDDVMSVMLWLELLRIIAKALLLLIMLALPFVAGLVNLGVMILEIVLSVLMLNRALKLDSNMKSFALILMSSVVVAFGFSMVMAFTGLISIGA